MNANIIELPIKIFLADDDDDDRLFFMMALADIDIKTELEVCKNGKELSTLLCDNAKSLPHIIFLDLNMPLQDGMECLKEIMNNEGHKKIPVVILSTSCYEPVIDKTYLLGASYYICKPNAIGCLKKCIENVLTINLHMGGIQVHRDKYMIASD